MDQEEGRNVGKQQSDDIVLFRRFIRGLVLTDEMSSCPLSTKHISLEKKWGNGEHVNKSNIYKQPCF